MCISFHGHLYLPYHLSLTSCDGGMAGKDFGSQVSLYTQGGLWTWAVSLNHFVVKMEEMRKFFFAMSYLE